MDNYLVGFHEVEITFSIPQSLPKVDMTFATNRLKIPVP